MDIGKESHNRRATDTKDDMLKIVDTSESLTLTELHELKKLAAMSKAARTIIAIVIGAIALVGADKMFDIMHKVGN